MTGPFCDCRQHTGKTTEMEPGRVAVAGLTRSGSSRLPDRQTKQPSRLLPNRCQCGGIWCSARSEASRKAVDRVRQGGRIGQGDPPQEEPPAGEARDRGEILRRSRKRWWRRDGRRPGRQPEHRPGPATLLEFGDGLLGRDREEVGSRQVGSPLVERGTVAGPSSRPSSKPPYPSPILKLKESPRPSARRAHSGSHAAAPDPRAWETRAIRKVGVGPGG